MANAQYTTKLSLYGDVKLKEGSCLEKEMVKDDEKEDQDLWQDYKRHEVDPGLNTSLYTVSQKVATFIFYDNFGKREPIFIFFSLLNSERICGERWN